MIKGRSLHIFFTLVLGVHLLVLALSWKEAAKPSAGTLEVKLRGITRPLSKQKELHKSFSPQAENQSPFSAGEQTYTGAESQIKSLYLSELQQEIEKNKFYPVIAKRLGQTGVVEVGFRISIDGNIDEVHLVKGSGSGNLDESALAAVRKVTKFKPIPRPINVSEIKVIVPIEFELF